MECYIYQVEHQSAWLGVSTLHRLVLYFDEGGQGLFCFFLIGIKKKTENGLGFSLPKGLLDILAIWIVVILHIMM